MNKFVRYVKFFIFLPNLQLLRIYIPVSGVVRGGGLWGLSPPGPLKFRVFSGWKEKKLSVPRTNSGLRPWPESKYYLINLWFFSWTGLPSLWWLFPPWGSPSCCGTQASLNTRPLLSRRIKANIVFTCLHLCVVLNKNSHWSSRDLQVSLLRTEMSPVSLCTGLLKL